MWEGACRGGLFTSTTTVSTHSVVSGAGHYYGIVVVSGTSVVVTTVKVYDNASTASGNLLDAVTISGTSLTAVTNYSLAKVFNNGVYVVVNNTAQATGTVWYANR